jgi:DNA-binding NtrC family response regulator
MDAHGGNKTHAARTLNIDYKTLLAKLKTYNLPA